MTLLAKSPDPLADVSFHTTLRKGASGYISGVVFKSSSRLSVKIQLILQTTARTTACPHTAVLANASSHYEDDGLLQDGILGRTLEASVFPIDFLCTVLRAHGFRTIAQT